MKIGIGLGVSQMASSGGVAPAGPVAFDFVSGPMFTDVAGTTPAVVTNSVARADDSTASNSFLQTVAASRPMLTASGLVYDGVDDIMLCTNLAVISILQSDSFQIDWIGEFVSITNNDAIFSIGSDTLTANTFMLQQVTDGRVKCGFEAQTTSFSTTAISLATSAHIRVTVSGGVQSIYVNNMVTPEVADATLGTASALNTLATGARYRQAAIALAANVTNSSMTITQL